MFDRTCSAIARRKAEVRFAEVAIRPEAMHPGFEHPALPVLSEAIIEARRLGATVLLMFGGGVIKSGCSPVILELVKRGSLRTWPPTGPEPSMTSNLPSAEKQVRISKGTSRQDGWAYGRRMR